MSETITASLTVSGGDTITAEINTLARGPVGPAGEGGSGAITSATTSDGTANLSISNVTTATAEVTGTLTANHIHGNLAGNVYAHVRAGEALAKGDPVYVSGSHGSGSTLIAIVSKADASNAAKMPAVGIMDAAVANNANGHMVITGTITELATNAYSINAELYVAAGGGMTATPPTARAQPVARVERSNLNNGAILVKVNGLSASDATASTLVRRTSIGGASFVGVDVTTLTAAGISSDGLVSFNGTGAGDSLTFNMVNYAYGTGAASAHRTALGSGATGDALFTALTPAAARQTALNEILKYDPNAAATRTNPDTYANDDTIFGINLTAGIWEFDFLFSFDAGACGVSPRFIFGTIASVDLIDAQNIGGFYRSNQNIASLAFRTTTGTITPPGNGASTNVCYSGFWKMNITGNTTLAMQFARNADSAGATIIRRAGAFLRARKING